MFSNTIQHKLVKNLEHNPVLFENLYKNFKKQ
jgi:hypothetical protein